MKPKRHRWVAVSLLHGLLLGLWSQAMAQPGRFDKQLQQRIKASIDLGLKYLRSKQEQNGSWNHYPGITALVVRAFMESPRQYTEEDGPFVRNALEYLASLSKPNGAIYHRDLPNYNTAVAVLALKASRNPKYQLVLEAARTFLLDSQLDERQGYSPQHPFYGAIGRGEAQVQHQPDLDNLGFALAALRILGLPAEHAAWQKALRFITRSQNFRESNDQAWAGNDGGFVFRPGFSYAGGTTSYASMTYVGLQSLLYARVGKHDPRVQAAFNWIRHHYTVDENRGLGQQALYHHYYFMATALHAYGNPIVVDAAGVQHHWRQELAHTLLHRQDFAGYWVNEVPLWWEGNPILATTFAILTLEQLYHD